MALSEKRQQEIMGLVGQGSGDLELDEQFALNEEKPHLRKLHRERADFLRTCTSAEELDFFAENWARDSREKPIHALIENPRRCRDVAPAVLVTAKCVEGRAMRPVPSFGIPPVSLHTGDINVAYFPAAAP